MNLYISDLDGTLLNPQAEITTRTRDILNELIAAGMNFSVATARTLATVKQMLAEINVNIPIILMNGVCVYDCRSEEYVKVESINYPARNQLLATVREHDMAGFLYSLDQERLSTFYEKIASQQAELFVQERVQKFGKVFTRVDDFQSCLNENIIYYSISDKIEKLTPFYNDLMQIDKLHVEIYRDVYHEDAWYIEVCSPAASKYNALKFLRERHGFTHITSFGDNLNDLPMFQASDYRCAVANAKTEVKAAADKIIGSNSEDGVALWLKSKFR